MYFWKFNWNEKKKNWTKNFLDQQFFGAKLFGTKICVTNNYNYNIFSSPKLCWSIVLSKQDTQVDEDKQGKQCSQDKTI